MIQCHLKTDNFTSYFPTWMPFISVSCLIALASLRVVSNKSSENGHSCLLPDFRRKVFFFFFFPIIEYDVSCELVIYGFLCWCAFLLYSICWQFLSWMDVEIYKMLFFPIYWNDIWFLFFILLMWAITLIDLHILNCPYILEINPIWSWCMILLMYCWIQFVENFWICILQGYWPVIFFSCTVLDWLWHQSNKGWLEPGPSSSSWEVVKLLQGRNWEMHGFCLLLLHEEWSCACLKIVSLFALVLWNSWMPAMLASRARWFGSLILRWQP